MAAKLGLRIVPERRPALERTPHSSTAKNNQIPSKPLDDPKL
jgi:hypothetical protein